MRRLGEVDSCVRIKNFMTPEEVRHFSELIQDRMDLFVETFGRWGFGPRYQVIDGDHI